MASYLGKNCRWLGQIASTVARRLLLVSGLMASGDGKWCRSGAVKLCALDASSTGESEVDRRQNCRGFRSPLLFARELEIGTSLAWLVAEQLRWALWFIDQGRSNPERWAGSSHRRGK